jgi:hypothetical protein
MTTRTRQVQLITQQLRSAARGVPLDARDIAEIRSQLAPQEARATIASAELLVDRFENADHENDLLGPKLNRAADLLTEKIVDRLDARTEAGHLAQADAIEIAAGVRSETIEVVPIGPSVGGVESVDVKYNPGETIVRDRRSRPWGG